MPVRVLDLSANLLIERIELIDQTRVDVGERGVIGEHMSRRTRGFARVGDVGVARRVSVGF